MDSVRPFGEGSASRCGGGHDCLGYSSGLSSLGRRGVSQPLWWRVRQVMAPQWTLLSRSVRAQPATVLAGTTGEGPPLASDRLVGVDSASNSGEGPDT